MSATPTPANPSGSDAGRGIWDALTASVDGGSGSETPSPSMVTLAKTMWGEARGEGAEGMFAVGCVIRNRAAHPRWWGAGIVGVCQHSARGVYQFDCWSPRDPNRQKLLTVTAKDAAYAAALLAAHKLLVLKAADITHNADTYADLATCRPAWANPARETVKIGRHTFFRLEI